MLVPTYGNHPPVDIESLFAPSPSTLVGPGLRSSGDDRRQFIRQVNNQPVKTPFNPPLEASTFQGNWNFRAGASVTDLNVGGGSVSCGGTTVVADTALTVHATSLNYVYLVCTLSPSTTDGYVTGGSVTAASIASYTSPQTDTNTTGYILLGTWQAGALVARFHWFSFGCELSNSGTGNTVFTYWAT